tara:strand:+ start:471 stop:731 length:261 start_codon:yes stop_codon:yes gene_type:complete
MDFYKMWYMSYFVILYDIIKTDENINMRDSMETKLWIDYNKKKSILRHYERMNLVSKERIFAEADMFRAIVKIYDYEFEKLAYSRN